MKILTIEPTPSPNSMKIVIDQDLPFGKSYNFTKDPTVRIEMIDTAGKLKIPFTTGLLLGIGETIEKIEQLLGVSFSKCKD